MDKISFDLISAYRKRMFRHLPGLRVTSQQAAIAFVEERGFIFFWPITGITLPSLWVAVAGDRPVADAHDDPGHVSWGWKDELLDKRAWYYGKILRKKATIISLVLAPYFYALSENYGAYDEDYLTQYEQGRLTLEAKLIYETLLSEGPLDTVALRRAIHMSNPASESRFNRALAALQSDLKILPVSVTQAGAWHYAFAYDIVARYYPEIPEKAHCIREDEARQKLVEIYLCSVGAARLQDLSKLFGWKTDHTQQAVDYLSHSGRLYTNIQFEHVAGNWMVLSDLL